MTTLSEALAPKSDQLNADDLIPGPRVLKITGGRTAKDGRQTRIILSFEGDQGKPFKPCKTMGRAMVMVWGLTDEGFASQVIGKSIRVYRDPEVTFGDQGQVGGIRISHMSHIDKPARRKLTVSQGQKREFIFHPLVTDSAATFTIDQARADIEFAASLDDLKTVWLRKSMTPFRANLQGDLDARKAALSAEGRSNEDMGEAHNGTMPDHDMRQKADDLIGLCSVADDDADLDAIRAELAKHARNMPDELVTEVETAIAANKVRFEKGGQG